MSYGNRIFNVNGHGQENLKETLRLAFKKDHRESRAVGYLIDPVKGMILVDGVHPRMTLFPSPLDADTVAIMVWAWLASKPEIECQGQDAAFKGDGDCKPGWRVYCEEWGRVETIDSQGNRDSVYATIIAVKPAHLWYGK